MALLHHDNNQAACAIDSTTKHSSCCSARHTATAGAAGVTCRVCCRLCRRKQQMSLQARRQLGYTGGTGKKDDKRHVLLTEDVAEALKDVRHKLNQSCRAACAL